MMRTITKSWMVFLVVLVVTTVVAAADPKSSSETNLRSTETSSSSRSLPNYWACQNDIARALQYCNTSLSIDERLDDLISHLTLTEKIQLLGADPQYDICETHTTNISRIGLPDYYWLVETNTAVAAACMRQDKCPTQFAGPLTLGASFNRTSWFLKGRVLGTEQRALMNVNAERFHKGTGGYVGLTAYGPNINQPRDPRFGRTSELPGEDPLAAGLYAQHMVMGMQERDQNGYPKVLAYLKHLVAYSREEGRGHDDYNISMYDLFDTYLRPFEIGMTKGGATGVMCSYNSVNGAPSCANSWLLNDILRQRWQRPDAHVTTDCDAVGNLMGAPRNCTDDACAAAAALENGSDVEMGSHKFRDGLADAVQRKLAHESSLDAAIRRSYRPHFVAGRFDDPTASEWYQLEWKDIHSPYHQQIQLEAALQGLVLLKNENATLPLAAGTEVAVLGPLGQTRDGLMSDYYGDQVCYGGGFDCVPTLSESIAAVNGLEHTVSVGGVEINSQSTKDVPLALAVGADADVIVLCLGITRGEEREGVDRTDTRLPGLQESFARDVFQLGKPVILVLVNAGQLAMENLVSGPSSVIEAFNPNSIGGRALALSVFGKENRWGKLPYTLYPYDVMENFDMVDHSMTNGAGRTYRYFNGEPMFRFGYGLSLTTFETSCFHHKNNETTITLECTVWNTGDRGGDEVIQVYHVPGDDIRRSVDHPVPIRQLVDFERVHVEAKATVDVRFRLDVEDALSLVNAKGDRLLLPGTRTISITDGVADPIEVPIVISKDGGVLAEA